jgi:hypothetical protein
MNMALNRLRKATISYGIIDLLSSDSNSNFNDLIKEKYYVRTK